MRFELEESVCRVSRGVCWTVALALLFAGGVMTGDAYLFDRLGGFSGGVSLAEPFLPASSLTRKTRNTRALSCRGLGAGANCGLLGGLVSLRAGARLKCLWKSRPGAWRLCSIAILLHVACFL